MAGVYENWITRLRVAWMGIRGQRIFGGFAAALGDRALEWSRQGLVEHFPEKASAAGNALTASERQIEPGPTETNAALGARLVLAAQSWKRAGAAAGILLALDGLGYTPTNGKPVLVQQNGRAFYLEAIGVTVPAPGFAVAIAERPDLQLAIIPLGDNPFFPVFPSTQDWWRFDDNNAFCSRFAIVFTGTLPSGWSAPVSPPTAGSAPNIDEVNRIRRVVHRWRPAKASFVAIYVRLTGRLWGWPLANWGDVGLTWGGTSVTWATEIQ